MEEGICYKEAEDTLDPEKLDLEKLAMEYKSYDLGSWQQEEDGKGANDSSTEVGICNQEMFATSHHLEQSAMDWQLGSCD